MIYDKTFKNLKEHYNLDELYAEPDYEREHKSPCKKHVGYDYKIYVAKGDIKFVFYSAVHWKADITKIPWYEIWTRIFVGDEITHYSADHAADAEYVMHMIIDVLDQAREKDDE